MIRKVVSLVAVIVLLLAGLAYYCMSSPAGLAKALTVYSAVKPLKVEPVRDGVYYATGGFSNSGFIVGDTGVIVIDAQMFAPSANKMLKAIAGITPLPVNTMILTHSDPDHVDALPAYPRGMQIIAQDNTRVDMQAALDNPTENKTPTPSGLKDYLPTKNVTTNESLVVDGVQMELLHIAPAHTDGDLIVYLPAKKIVFAGDILTPGSGPYPGIHLEKHGSSLGWIKTMQALIALDADIYVSGHGEPLKHDDLQPRLDAAVQRRAEIARMVAQNKSLDEVKAILNDPPPTGVEKGFPTFTDTTYQELTQK
ncbi:MBL fold metallo-hydrolase [Caballeronia sp. dw_276]|uniref:MBL fold metallo-hydrolase n=1 Tax=Caballeronia sp. dw_276 TaxID=2719795 RepID=UPI001BD59F31|nr:MBL fold metallo-hydrolase [Caballeronia sp. dw_276]